MAQYYLCFSINRIPDLTLAKYSVFDGSGVSNIIDKHGVFLRQLHRLGSTAGVFFHLLYFYNPSKMLTKGKHLSIVFYATSENREKLDGIREFLTSSVLSVYYDFRCYDIATDFSIVDKPFADGSHMPVLRLTNISGHIKEYGLSGNALRELSQFQSDNSNDSRQHIVCELASDANAVLSINHMPVDELGRIAFPMKFRHAAFLTKKDYFLPAQNRLSTDSAGEINLYSVMQWEPSESGRLFNVLKLMEGYNSYAILRIDIFPVEHTQAIRARLPYAETRRRIADHAQGKDDNSETIVKSWDDYLKNLMKFPQFLANVVAFAETEDIAVMLADSVAAEAVESGTYLIERMESSEGFTMYASDNELLHRPDEPGNYILPLLSLYTLEEIRPMFSFPILYPGESIECQKETDPIPKRREIEIDSVEGEVHETISLGTSAAGYDVTFPVKSFKKHAFIAGVPGSGKTNTMLYLVTTLWKGTKQHIPFLVLEPAKQEYRALAKLDGMEDLCVFSPGADTKFPLHINPFQFPVGLTLAEHIANLNAVFAGAFELPMPSPFLIDSCIEKVYLDKGWNVNERNTGSKTYPTMQELYDSLKVAVESSGYEGESKSNIRSVMEVRIGSLLRREIGNVYNVRQSSLDPEEWLNRPIVVELEALGEGPANFMSLLISTLIREVLKIRKTSENKLQLAQTRNVILRQNLGNELPVNVPDQLLLKPEVEHVIFYEEAHNLIGPETENPMGDSVDPKISATKYLVKMLAEVRALGEGIVIADQLPTAMAPEVLKNTGLKLGHRITAQDDRSLMGSTMSATPDQLEEQGTFATGEALIFYEDLLKPYKMRVCEWEKGSKIERKYESPTNEQLFALLKHNKVYQQLLAKSAFIMQEKMATEFAVLRDKLRDIVVLALNENADPYTLENRIANLEKGIRLHDSNEKTYRNNVIALQNEYNRIILRAANELTTICHNYVNLYYAYMTLSNNYDSFSNSMYLCTTNNFMSLFNEIAPCVGAKEIRSTLFSNVSDALDYAKQYVAIDEIPSETSGLSSDAIVSKFMTIGYHTAVIADEGDAFIEEFKCHFSQGNIEQEWLIDFHARFVSYWSRSYDLTHTFDTLASLVNNSIIPTELTDCLYTTLSNTVISLFNSANRCSDSLRIQFVSLFKPILTDIRNIVNYRSQSASARLSCSSSYLKIWSRANCILMMEMLARFGYFESQYEKVINAWQSGNSDFDALNYHCEMINTIFRIYYNSNCRLYKFRLALLQHYLLFINRILELGSATYPTLFKYSIGNWKLCDQMIIELNKAGHESNSTYLEWNRSQDKMYKALLIFKNN